MTTYETIAAAAEAGERFAQFPTIETTYLGYKALRCADSHLIAAKVGSGRFSVVDTRTGDTLCTLKRTEVYGWLHNAARSAAQDMIDAATPAYEEVPESEEAPAADDQIAFTF
jgi:hypothetical protein